MSVKIGINGFGRIGRFVFRSAIKRGGFGIARGVLIVSIILFVLDLFTPIAKMNEWNNSILIPYFSPIVKYLIHYAQASSSFINEHINL